MIRPRLSVAASRLLRAIVDRAGDESHRILLCHVASTDWQSLTFVGERHEIELAVAGPEPEALLARLTGDLGEAEFSLPRQLLADILVCGQPERRADGSLLVRIEALTIEQ